MPLTPAEQLELGRLLSKIMAPPALAPLAADTPRSIRELSGLATTEALADRAGLSVVTVRNTEAGRVCPHGASLQKMAQATRYPERYIAAVQRLHEHSQHAQRRRSSAECRVPSSEKKESAA